MNYSVLLPRSADFDAYSQVMYPAYPDQVERPLILDLAQLLWDRGEGDGYAQHMTTDPLPNTIKHTVLLDVGARRPPGHAVPGRRRGAHDRRVDPHADRRRPAARRRPSRRGASRRSGPIPSPGRRSSTGTRARRVVNVAAAAEPPQQRQAGPARARPAHAGGAAAEGDVPAPAAASIDPCGAAAVRGGARRGLGCKGMGDVRIGYKASAEQFDPATLLQYTRHAEEVGLEIVATSDHFQPWRHREGHSPAALPWLGAATQADVVARCWARRVLTPTLRYEPAIVAQAFATLGCLAPGRVFLGVGTGEAMNETPATGARVPGAQGAAAADGRGDRADPQALARGARRLRGRVLHDVAGHDLRPARRRGPDLRRRVRAAGRQARGARRRRLHLHVGQGPAAVPRPAGEGQGGRRAGRARPRADPAHDRDQGLLRPRQAEGATTTATSGRRWR